MQAYMFPGQGSQSKGMGKELFSLYPDLCRLADATLGYSVEELCLYDPEKKLNRTSYTQPAIFFTGCLEYLHTLEQEKQKPDLVLGHSLGLFTALFASEVFDLETGLKIVSKRGRLMEAASDGGMLAILGQGVEHLPELMIQHQITDIDLANLNTPTQAVLSGKQKSLAKAEKIFAEEGFNCVSLPVSGPFHSRYMESAREEFTRFIMELDFAKPSIPVISTTSAEVIDEHFLLEEMSFQLIKPVRWMQTIKLLSEKYPGIRFREIGHGNVLERLNHKIL